MTLSAFPLFHNNLMKRRNVYQCIVAIWYGFIFILYRLFSNLVLGGATVGNAGIGFTFWGWLMLIVQIATIVFCFYASIKNNDIVSLEKAKTEVANQQ